MARAARVLLGLLLLLPPVPRAALAGPGWAQALAPRAWAFPRDHGAHPEYRTEWWYFTGNLRDGSGGRYGYQITFFRVGVVPEPLLPGNPWSVRDVYLAHLAVTDAGSGTFRYEEAAGRPGPGLAGASPEGLRVWLLGWSARMEEGVVRLEAPGREVGIELVLRPRKPVVLHGEGGLSPKGPRPGQASFYASITDLATEGRIRPGPGRGWVGVSGTSWFDHEFGSNQLAPDQAGWDWMGLHLSDGRDLMVYVLRRTDGSVERASSGTLVEPGGRARRLGREDFEIRVRGRWTSPRSGARYPGRWRVRVPPAGIDLTLAPLVPDQELEASGISYWEGAVSGGGTSAGRRVRCEGYVELTGYAGPLGDLF